LKITFAGGASTVTGSCYYLEVSGLRLLVDCGMRQGNGADALNRAPFPFVPADIDHVFVTHAHIDHSGLLPRLFKEGFRGTVISTPATRDLLRPMLHDSAAVQQSDSEWGMRKGLRSGRPPVEPLYGSEDVECVLPLFDVRPYDRVFNLGRGVKFRLLDAGHILGSATLELWFDDGRGERKAVFSGDIGKKGKAMLKDPDAPGKADYVVMEATYGDRDHRPMNESVLELAAAIRTTFKRGGNVYIPSFAVGRSQDMLYTLMSLVREGRLYRIDVFLDSPLAEAATRVYLAHPECLDEEARRLFSTRRLNSSLRLHFVKTAEESMRLNRIRSGVIVIAGSGMCEGGRIRHHLKHNLWRSECGVIFPGFQAKGTLGRAIVDGAGSVVLLGEEVAVKAAVYTINGFSAHAGREELSEWVSAFKDRPRIFLAHAEARAAASFGLLVKDRFGLETTRPADGDSFEL
jgi:metallo-beta-lactamase family protein